MGTHLLLLGSIFAISLVLTMVGLGGGLIFSPLFMLLDFPRDQAVAASLFLNGVAAVSASWVYFRKKMVDVPLSLPLVGASMLGAPLGAWCTHLVRLEVFLLALAGILLLAAVRMLWGGRPDPGQGTVSTARKVAGGAAIGLVIGFVGGMLGIGGGVFVVPLLIYFLKVPTKTAAASSIFIVCFSSFSAFATHASLAHLDWGFILGAAAFSFAGGQVGSRIMAEKLKGRTIRVIFAGVLVVMCAKLLWRVWG